MTAGAIRNRADECWRGDSTYAFVDQQAPTRSEATSYVFSPDSSREGQARGPLVDEFGEATGIVSVLGEEPPRHLFRV